MEAADQAASTSCIIAAHLIRTANTLDNSVARCCARNPLVRGICPRSVDGANAGRRGAGRKGESVYADYCWTCHGERLRNPGGGTSFDLRRLRPGDYARFVSSVLNGKNAMPPWRGVLDTEQIDAIWAYIRANVDR
jgi:mono/diheme cytochrome c family protein